MKRYHVNKADRTNNTVFRVPNNDEGRKFLNDLRFYSAGGTRVRVHTRGPRVKHAMAKGLKPRAYDQDLPVAHATEFAVYIEKPQRDRLYAQREAEFRKLREGTFLQIIEAQKRELERLQGAQSA